MISKRILKGAFIVVGLAGAAAPTGGARAQPSPSAASPVADKLTEEGLTLYRAQDYRHALEKFLAAYALEADPNQVFNAARCYERLNDQDAAIEKYKAFLAVPGGDPSVRRKAEDALAALEKAKAEPKPAAAPAEPPRAPVVTHDAPWRTIAWVSTGAGLAAGLVGTVVYFLGQGDHNQITGATGYGQPGQVVGVTQAQAQQMVDSGVQKKTAGVALWGVGGVALAAGAVFFVVGARQKGPPARSAFVPRVSFGAAPTACGAELLFRGRF